MREHYVKTFFRAGWYKSLELYEKTIFSKYGGKFL